jgi:hypothetical protein
MATIPPRRAGRRCPCPQCQQHPCGATARAHRDINRFLATLNERQRRLFAGFLARCQGRGAIRRLARITGLSRNTIRRGLREFGRLTPTASQRIRRPRGGRKPVECLGGIL